MNKEELKELKFMFKNGMITKAEYKKGLARLFREYFDKAVFNIDTPREYVI